MHLSFLKKKKKKKWNGIVAMALPNSIPLFTIPKGFFYPPISAMSLPQLPKIYTLYFSNTIATNFFFPSHFRQWHCHTCQNFFFSHHLVFLARTHTSSTHPGSRYGQKELRQYHCRKSKISLSYFLSFSLQFLLNFDNGIAAIHSLFSNC